MTAGAEGSGSVGHQHSIAMRSLMGSMCRIDARLGDLIGRTGRDRRAFLAAGRQHHGAEQAPQGSSAPSCQRRLPARRLARDVRRRGAAKAGARRNRCVDRQHREHSFGDARLPRPASRPASGPTSSTPFASASGDQPAGDVVRVAERQFQHAHQPVGQIGRGGEAGAGKFAHPRQRPASCRAPCRRWRRATAPRPRRRRTPVPCPPACPWHRPAAGPSSPSAAPTSAPVIRPVLARTSSAASGLRFCGMIELPVVNASDSRMKRHGALHQITISSAKRDRCIAEIAAAPRNSSAKSRSDTASSELAVGRSKPSACAVIARSIGNDVPASAALPSGHSFSRRRHRRAGRGRGPASRHRPADDGRTSPAARFADG